MGKLGNIWKTMLRVAPVAALAALNAAIQRGASEPDDSALGGRPTSQLETWTRLLQNVWSGACGPPLIFMGWRRCLELYVAQEF